MAYQYARLVLSTSREHLLGNPERPRQSRGDFEAVLTGAHQRRVFSLSAIRDDLDQPWVDADGTQIFDVELHFLEKAAADGWEHVSHEAQTQRSVFFVRRLAEP